VTDNKNLEPASPKNVRPTSGSVSDASAKPAPSLRDRLRPVELLAIAAVLGLFTGLIVLMATREPMLALIFFGVAFIATLVVTALFVLGMKPTEAEQYDVAAQNGQYPRRPVLYDDEEPVDGAGPVADTANDTDTKKRRNPHD
jgi:hypothetical protein